MNLNDMRNELEDISHSLRVTSDIIQDILNGCTTTDKYIGQAVDRVYIMTEYIYTISAKIDDIAAEMRNVETKGTDI